MQKNQLVHHVLYNGFISQQQNHLYILVGASLEQQRDIYHWYMKLHACQNRNDEQVCGSCSACVQIEHDNYVNSLRIQKPADKKSIGVEEIAMLQEIFMSTAQIKAERFFCVEEADLLTPQAANSILKFLEEPVGETIGFLFTKNEQSLLSTIRSRGQIFRLLPEVDEKQQVRVAQNLPDSVLQKSAFFLIGIGYTEQQVLKHISLLYETVLTFLQKLIKGMQPIVLQADLEAVAQQTKSGSMVLELMIYLIELAYRDDFTFADNGEVAIFINTEGSHIYIAAYHALQRKRYHFGNSMLFTDFSLNLIKRLSR